MALEADLLLNTRRFQAGVQDAERELRDFTDVLDLLADGTEDAGRKGERAFDTFARESRAVEDEVRQLARRVGDVGDAADDAGDKARRGFRRAEEGVQEFRDEANSTAREAAASFDGSAESIGDAFQEVAANALGGFGPVGAAAGIAVAAGIGIAIEAINQYGENQERINELAGEWAARYIEAGGTILSTAQRIAAYQELVLDPDRYREAITNADNWGVAHSTAVSAMIGDEAALTEVRGSLNERQAEAARIVAELADGSRTATQAEAELLGQVERGTGSFSNYTQAAAQSADMLDLNDRMLRELAESADGATREIDAAGDAVYALPDGTQIYIDAETGRATANIDHIEQRIYAVPDGHATVNVSVNDSAIDRFMNRNLTRVAAVHVRVQQGMNTWE